MSAARIAELQEEADRELREKQKSSYTELHDAARMGNLRELQRMLLHAKKANSIYQVDAANRLGQTALVIAAAANQTVATRLVVSYGADVNKVDDSGISALYCAASHGYRSETCHTHKRNPVCPIFLFFGAAFAFAVVLDAKWHCRMS